MGKIYAELSRIQKDLKAPKNLYNSFGKYSYRNAEGILEAVKPMLNGLALIINDEPVMIGDRFYIKATVTLTDGEESVSAVAYAREDETKKGMDGCQVTGACSSYARKYALNALLMIDDSKDSDDDTLSPKNPANAPDQEPGPAFTRPNVKPTGTSGTPGATSGTQGTASVTKVSKVTEVKELSSEREAPKKELNEVQEYFLVQMGNLREQRGISAKQNNKLFADQTKKLKDSGLAPDKPLEDYTKAEAEALIDAMRKCFPPDSAELLTR